jgi:hypothetical protein
MYFYLINCEAIKLIEDEQVLKAFDIQYNSCNLIINREGQRIKNSKKKGKKRRRNLYTRTEGD